MEIYDTAAAAGLWKYVGCKYQSKNPPGYVVDEAAVRFVHEFDPAFEHLWCIHLYQSPGGKYETRAYHAIARHIVQTISGGNPGELVDVELPPERARLGPVYVSKVMHGLQRDNHAPPSYVPWTMQSAKNMETWYAAFRKRMNGEKHTKREMMTARTEAEVELDETCERMEYEMHQDRHRFDRLYDEGKLWAPAWEPTPFVHVRAASPAA